MDLQVEYRCVLDEERGTIGLPLESITGTNVEGLKIVLQELLGVPTSDISAFLNGTPLVEDKMPLKQLYLRENDHFRVEFNGRGSLATIQQLIAELETFKGLTTCHEQQGTIQLSKCNTALINRQSYSQIDIAIIRLCGLFLPWNSRSTTANKLFFIQQGGADLFIDIFKFSTKVFVDVDTNRGSGDFCAASVYNSYQLVLMILCLRLLWTFAETKTDGQLMLSKGVEPLVFNALLLDPDSHRHAKGHHGIIKNISNANQEAIGCLAGLAETEPDVQEHIAKNGLVLRKLMIMINRKRKTAVLHYPLFTSQLAAASLYFCTFNEYPLEYLVQKGVHYQVMKILQQLLEDISGDLILRFYCVLFLGKIRTSELNCLNNNDGAAVDCLIERFLGRHKPHEIQSWNEQNSCHWKSLVPCVEMMYASGKYCMCNESLLNADASAWNYGSSKCDCTSNNAENEEMHKNVRTKEPHVKHKVYCEAALCEQIDDMIVSSQSNSTYTCRCMKRLPSASERTHSEISWPGSHSTQRLGIFTLQCLLPIKHNCNVLIQENLLPYVITLGWQLQNPERLALNKALCYIKNVKSRWNPPSLEVIISSLFARRDGFNKVRQHQLSGTLYSRFLK